MTYDVTIEVREDMAQERIDRLSDDLGEYLTDISGARLTMRGLDIVEVWGALNYIAEDEVPVRRLTVEEGREMPIHSEIAREDGSTLTVELVEDQREAPGVIIRALSTGETGVDVKLYLTHEDAKALADALTEAIGRGEERRR